jgi:hypothetical protein
MNRSVNQRSGTKSVRPLAAAGLALAMACFSGLTPAFAAGPDPAIGKWYGVPDQLTTIQTASD